MCGDMSAIPRDPTRVPLEACDLNCLMSTRTVQFNSKPRIHSNISVEAGVCAAAVADAAAAAAACIENADGNVQKFTKSCNLEQAGRQAPHFSAGSKSVQGLLRLAARKEAVALERSGGGHNAPVQHARDEGGGRAGDDPASEDDGDQSPVEGIDRAIA